VTQRARVSKKHAVPQTVPVLSSIRRIARAVRCISPVPSNITLRRLLLLSAEVDSWRIPFRTGLEARDLLAASTGGVDARLEPAQPVHSASDPGDPLCRLRVHDRGVRPQDPALVVQGRWLPKTTPARGSQRRGIVHSYALLAQALENGEPPQALVGVRRVCPPALLLGCRHRLGSRCPGPTSNWRRLPSARALQTVVFGLATLKSACVDCSAESSSRSSAPSARQTTTSPFLLLTAWTASGVLAAPQTSEPWLATYFALTAVLLLYVPFTKISHYVYWFFLRYYVGYYFGHRGVYPAKYTADAAGSRVGYQPVGVGRRPVRGGAPLRRA